MKNDPIPGPCLEVRPFLLNLRCETDEAMREPTASYRFGHFASEVSLRNAARGTGGMAKIEDDGSVSPSTREPRSQYHLPM